MRKLFLVALLTSAVYAVNNTSFSRESNVKQTIHHKKHITNKLESQSIDKHLESNKVVLNFEQADIQSVIKAISKLSGKNFVIDPRVKGTVNIVSNEPIAKADSYKVLETALRMQGFACVEADGVINVIPENEAKTYGAHTDLPYSGSNNGSSTAPRFGDQLVTKVFTVAHGSASSLVGALRPLISSNNSISVYSSTNSIVVTDYASNMKRISNLVEQLTTVGGNNNNGILGAGGNSSSSTVIIDLKNAVASDVAQTLRSYLGSGGGTNSHATTSGNAPDTNITVDTNSNSVIIYSPVKSTLNDLVHLADKLDQYAQDDHGNLHVVYLKNAEANHIADVLTAVINQEGNPDLTATSAQAKFSSEPSSTFSGSTGGGSTGSSGNPAGGGGASAQPSQTQSHSYSSSKSSNSSSAKDMPKIFVQAEPTTNSLIIQAPPAVYKNLRMIIDMLDVRRAEVMIEALIADINTTEEGAFGIQWLTGAGNNNIGGAVVSNYGGSLNGQPSSSLSSMASNILGAEASLNPAMVAANAEAMGAGGMGGGMGNITLPNEVFVGLVSGTTTIGGQTVPGIGALADMIAANNVGNIISRPTVLTLDNEEARIMVGENIGIPNGSFQNTGGLAGGMVSTVTRQDLGTVLQIKPSITQNGAIQLDIYQEDSSIDPNETNVDLQMDGPNFLKQNMRTTILVDDGQIIALGGMTQDKIELQQNGIPLLSSIPYVGWLFSWQERVHEKQNMILFLRPVIIKNADGYKALTNERYKYVVGLQNAAKATGNLVLPSVSPVTLDNQLPYKNNKLVPSGSSSLNLNTNLPIIDTTRYTHDAPGSSAQSSVSDLIYPNLESNISDLHNIR